MCGTAIADTAAILLIRGQSCRAPQHKGYKRHTTMCLPCALPILKAVRGTLTCPRDEAIVIPPEFSHCAGCRKKLTPSSRIPLPCGHDCCAECWLNIEYYAWDQAACPACRAIAMHGLWGKAFGGQDIADICRCDKGPGDRTFRCRFSWLRSGWVCPFRPHDGQGRERNVVFGTDEVLHP